jgi:hypothetical protein
MILFLLLSINLVVRNNHAQSIRTVKNQENLDYRELDMAVRYIRFISVREELAGKSILSYQSLRIRIIVRNQGSLYNAGKRKIVGLLGA